MTESLEDPKILLELMLPAWINTQRVKDCIGVYEGVASHAGEINDTTHVSFFGITQQLALEGMAIGICKIYDTSNQKYKKHTVAEILSTLENTKIFHHSRVQSQELIKIGIEEAKAQEILDLFTRDTDKAKAHLILRIKELMPSISSNQTLKEIFFYRNKIAAHQEILSASDKEASKFLPSIDTIEKLNNWAEGFCFLFAKLVTPDTALVRSVATARMAALNVVRKVLEKKFDGPNAVEEQKAFYARRN